MKNPEPRTYRIECRYDAFDMLGGIEHRNFLAGDFISDIEIKKGDRLAYESCNINVNGFYLGTVIDVIDIPDKNFSYIRCFNDKEKDATVSFKFEQDVERQMKMINSIRKREDTRFARLFKIRSAAGSGLYIVNCR